MKAIAKAAEGVAVSENYYKRVENDNSKMRHKFTSPIDDKQAQTLCLSSCRIHK